MEYFEPDENNEYDSGQSINNENNQPQNNQSPIDENWLDNYAPQYFVGSKDTKSISLIISA